MACTGECPNALERGRLLAPRVPQCGSKPGCGHSVRPSVRGGCSQGRVSGGTPLWVIGGGWGTIDLNIDNLFIPCNNGFLGRRH